MKMNTLSLCPVGLKNSHHNEVNKEADPSENVRDLDQLLLKLTQTRFGCSLVRNKRLIVRG